MASCLIGHTGFVGSNLIRQIEFDCTYNSTNIDEARGKSFDVVYCAGVSAVKWMANKEPDIDLNGIMKLINVLREIDAGRFVLLSTIDVYRCPVGVDEETPISSAGLHAYGTHRRMVESFVAERFPLHHIVRLPGLFGDNLKKNIIYDFLHHNQEDAIHSDAVFQFYGLHRLATDIGTVIDSDLRLINFATEPISVKNIAAVAFERKFVNHPFDNPPHYDMRTRFGSYFGSDTPYILSGGEVLDEIRAFVARQKSEVL